MRGYRNYYYSINWTARYIKIIVYKIKGYYNYDYLVNGAAAYIKTMVNKIRGLSHLLLFDISGNWTYQNRVQKNQRLT